METRLLLEVLLEVGFLPLTMSILNHLILEIPIQTTIRGDIPHFSRGSGKMDAIETWGGMGQCSSGRITSRLKMAAL
jgi:hypothetical protein